MEKEDLDPSLPQLYSFQEKGKPAFGALITVFLPLSSRQTSPGRSNNGISAVISRQTSLRRSNNGISAVVSRKTSLRRSNNGISAVVSRQTRLRRYNNGISAVIFRQPGIPVQIRPSDEPN
ncbi:hypothetical protein [Paenibacillus jilunlii]|uniref:hypothetical protein n=1 Tax=Paenibacillus jilunlii TaxID=682956 RepID=UPI0012FB3FA7|nr:hypothetical protein [Paenibacillus jilunlii]